MRMGSAMGAIDQRTGIAGRTVVCAAVSKPVPSALGNAVVQGMRCASETEESILLMLARSFVEGETLCARFVNAGAWLRNV